MQERILVFLFPMVNQLGPRISGPRCHATDLLTGDWLAPPAFNQALTQLVLEPLELSEVQRAELAELQSENVQRLAEMLSTDQLRKVCGE